MGYSPWGRKTVDMTEGSLSLSLSLSHTHTHRTWKGVEVSEK